MAGSSRGSYSRLKSDANSPVHQRRKPPVPLQCTTIFCPILFMAFLIGIIYFIIWFSFFVEDNEMMLIFQTNFTGNDTEINTTDSNTYEYIEFSTYESPTRTENRTLNAAPNITTSTRIPITTTRDSITAHNKKTLKLVCYYNYPSYDNTSGSLLPENITCDLCTHIIVAFASVKNHTVHFDDNMIRAIISLNSTKQCEKQPKIMFSIGGATADDGFPDMVINHATRKMFIRSLKTVLALYRLDGVDLDWEFPAVKELKDPKVKDRQRQHFTQLLREIRVEFQRERKGYLLSVAVAAQETIVDAAYDVRYMNDYVDFVNLMTYDFHTFTKFTPFTGFNSPLYPRKEDHLFLATLNINYTANMWNTKGIDRDKIVIGLPTFGHSFTLVNIHNTVPGSPANGFGKTGTLGFVDYSEVCKYILNNKPNVIFDNVTFSPYLFYNTEWISFDNRDSLIIKTNYIKDNNFGGAMIYSLNADDYSGHCSEDGSSRFILTRLVSETLFDFEL